AKLDDRAEVSARTRSIAAVNPPTEAATSLLTERLLAASSKKSLPARMAISVGLRSRSGPISIDARCSASRWRLAASSAGLIGLPPGRAHDPAGPGTPPVDEAAPRSALDGRTAIR